MEADRARTLHRLLLGAALAVKGVVWEAAPTTVAMVLIVAGLVVMAGWWSRLALALAGTLIWALLLSDTTYSNHLVLLGSLSTIAAVFPHGSAGEMGSAERLSMLQVSVVYFWAGVWKVNPEFLSGAVLDFEWNRSWLLGAGSAPQEILAAAAVATVVGEVVLAGLLWSRRLVVPWALGLAGVLHLGMVLTIGPSVVVTGELVAFALACASTFPLFLTRAGVEPYRRESAGPQPPSPAATST